MHARILPVKNVFSYGSTYIAFPLFKVNLIKKFILSVNSFNLFSFYDKDHGERTKNSSTKEWALSLIKEAGFVKEEISEIILLTHLRCMGFVFNPVSFYFCFNKSNEIITIIAEVNNTFSQTHSYVIYEEDKSPIIQNKIYKAEKEFFVSPFLTREGNYEFRFNYGEEKIKIFINYFKENKLVLFTSLIGSRSDLNSYSLIFSIGTTFKTVALIVYQALKLITKKIKFRRPPSKLKNQTTFNKHD